MRGALIAPLNINLHETVEFDLLTGGAEQRFFDGNLEDGLIVNRRYHLACYETVPDQRVELEHVAPQKAPHPLGRVFQRGRPNRLVGILRALFRAKGVGLTGHVVLAVLRLNVLAHAG